VLSWCIGGDVNAIITGAYPYIDIHELVHKNGAGYKVSFIYLSPWEMVEPGTTPETVVVKSITATNLHVNLQGGNNKGYISFDAIVTMSDGTQHTDTHENILVNAQSGGTKLVKLEGYPYNVGIKVNDNNHVTGVVFYF
jgi:hypothetical protein